MLLLAPALAPAAHFVLVKPETLTIREKPSKSGNSIDKLVAFQPVELLKTEGDWAQVKTPKSLTGYAQAAYLTPSAFVFTGEDKVNARRGPGTQYDTIIVYEEPNLPLRVLDATDTGWLMVMDYEGDRSWVSAKGVRAAGRYVVVKEPNCNVRKGVGIGQDLAFIAPKGVIMKVLEEKAGWLHVKCTDGDEGWLSAKTVFGWLDVDAPGSGKTDAPAATAGSKNADSTDASTAAGSKASAKKKSGGNSEGEDASAKKPAARKTSTKKKSGASADDEDASAKKPSAKKKAGASADDEDAPAKKPSAKKKAGASADDEDAPASKPSAKKKAGSTRAVSLHSDSKATGSGSSETEKTGSRRTRSRKAPSKSDE